MGAVLLAATAFAFVWLGYEIARRRWREDIGPLELWSAALLIGSTLWIGTAWTAALLHLLDRPTILARTGVVLLAALGLWLQRTRGRVVAVEIDERNVRHLLPLLPIVLWIVFVLWRSTIVPPASHDALSYHLPRAVLWIREHAFFFIDLPVDARMRVLPANYEILLSDAILLTGGDALTEWVSVFSYIAFVVATAALVERWWQPPMVVLVGCALLTASLPVLLLHTGADKNDLMTGFFMLAALLWAGRWISQQDGSAATMCGVALIAATGTKPQGVLLAAALFPFVIASFARAARLRMNSRAALARAALVLVIAVVVLGGAFSVARAMQESATAAAERRNFVAYDDWANLWQAPWVLLTAPFSPWSDALYVPWADTPWFWKRHELYFSHLGVPFSLCALLLPFAMRCFRNDLPSRRIERRAMFFAALITVVLMFPVRDVPMPHGVYTITLPRYAMFFAPVVFAWVVAPALARLQRKSARAAAVAVTALAVWFCGQAADAAVNDRFVPIEYVLVAREHPGTRFIAFDPTRAASIADRQVPPGETIYFDAGYAAWIHPAFGADLKRPVKFIDQPVIPPDAKWIVVDRSFRIIWQNAQFHDLSQAGRYLMRGSPTPRDTALVSQLLNDPRFRVVFFDRWRNQAVFQRIR